MVEPAVILGATAVVGLSPSAAVLGMRYRNGQAWAASLTAHTLHLPQDLDLTAVEAFLSGLGGLQATGWRRAVAICGLALEVVAAENGIRYRLLVTPEQEGTVTAHLRAALPNVGLETEDDPALPQPTLAVELVPSSRHYQLRVDQPEVVSRAVLAALAPLPAGQSLIVQWLICPVNGRPPEKPLEGSWRQTLLGPGPELSPAQAKSQRDKYTRPLFGVSLRLGVVAPSRATSRLLLRRLTDAFHTASSPQARLRRRSVTSRAVARAIVDRTPPLGTWPGQLNTAELSGLLALAPAGTTLPGLDFVTTVQRAPTPEIATSGRIIADSTYPGLDRPLAISYADALTHTYVLGPTGVGKSTLLLGSANQDMEAGYGVIFVDGKGDGVEALKALIPASRHDDVVILDPVDDELPVGFNVLATGTENPELAAEMIVGCLHRLFATSWGPRMADALYAAAISVAAVPGSTVADIPVILTNPAFQQRIISQLPPAIALGVASFWNWYSELGNAERSQIVAPIVNKLRPILVRPRLRRVLSSAEPRLDLDEALATGKIILAALPAGLLGDEATALLGSLLIAALWGAIQRRARLPQDLRRPVFLYVDEFQRFEGLPTPLGEILAQARGLGVGVVLANQHLTQLSPETQAAVLGTARSRIIFQTSATDAARLAREVEPYISAANLRGLAAFEVVAQLATGGRTAPPVTGRTRPTPPPSSDPETIRQASRERYGRPAAEVDAELRRRHEQSTGSGPIGRQRRPQ